MRQASTARMGGSTALLDKVLLELVRRNELISLL